MINFNFYKAENNDDPEIKYIYPDVIKENLNSGNVTIRQDKENGITYFYLKGKLISKSIDLYPTYKAG